MTDLQINIELAQALGWILSEKFTPMHDQYDVFRGKVFCNKDGVLRKFDYRDPIIFVAICKRWGLVVNFGSGYASAVAGINIVGEWEKPRFIEKAAALVVIELAKRGVK